MWFAPFHRGGQQADDQHRTFKLWPPGRIKGIGGLNRQLDVVWVRAGRFLDREKHLISDRCAVQNQVYLGAVEPVTLGRRFPNAAPGIGEMSHRGWQVQRQGVSVGAEQAGAAALVRDERTGFAHFWLSREHMRGEAALGPDLAPQLVAMGLDDDRIEMRQVVRDAGEDGGMMVGHWTTPREELP